jgi:hypothetical protein
MSMFKLGKSTEFSSLGGKKGLLIIQSFVPIEPPAFIEETKGSGGRWMSGSGRSQGFIV